MRKDYLAFGRPTLLEPEIEEVVATLRSGWIGTGPKVLRFETAFRAYADSRHAVAVSSCTAALHPALLVSGLEPGDEVITTPLTFVATANAILHAGGRPVFVDVDRGTGTLDPARIEAAITRRTHAILPVHYAGRPCDMDAVTDIAARRALAVIEDAAHCIEGRYRSRKIGSISDLTCFSFYPTKSLTTAEGGMITTSSAAWARRLTTYRLHGLSSDAWRRYQSGTHRRYEAVVPRFKYNMTDLQASLGLAQLERVPANLARREEIWSRYDEAAKVASRLAVSSVEPSSTTMTSTGW